MGHIKGRKNLVNLLQKMKGILIVRILLVPLAIALMLPTALARLAYAVECDATCLQCDQTTGTCISCPLGSEPSGGGCQVCDPGYYNDSTGSGLCIFCPIGSYAATSGSDECIQCPPGYTSNSSRTGCVLDSDGCVCIGFEPPMDKEVFVKKKNRVLPLKMVLIDQATGMEITDAEVGGYPPLLEVDYDGVGSAVPEGEDYLPAGQGDEGNEFTYSGNYWQFNLQTKNFSGKGGYTIWVVAPAGANYIINTTCVAWFTIM